MSEYTTKGYPWPSLERSGHSTWPQVDTVTHLLVHTHSSPVVYIRKSSETTQSPLGLWAEHIKRHVLVWNKYTNWNAEKNNNPIHLPRSLKQNLIFIHIYYIVYDNEGWDFHVTCTILRKIMDCHNICPCHICAVTQSVEILIPPIYMYIGMHVTPKIPCISTDFKCLEKHVLCIDINLKVKTVMWICGALMKETNHIVHFFLYVYQENVKHIHHYYDNEQSLYCNSQ